MDEYRFQVTLNQQRIQGAFALSLGVAAAATALLGSASDAVTFAFVAILFALGAIISLVAAYAVRVGHVYYREIRNHKARIEDKLGLGDLSISTTSGMKGRNRRITITRLTITTLVLIALADVGGAGYSLHEAVVRSGDGRPPATWPLLNLSTRTPPILAGSGRVSLVGGNLSDRRPAEWIATTRSRCAAARACEPFDAWPTV